MKNLVISKSFSHLWPAPEIFVIPLTAENVSFLNHLCVNVRLDLTVLLTIYPRSEFVVEARALFAIHEDRPESLDETWMIVDQHAEFPSKLEGGNQYLVCDQEGFTLRVYADEGGDYADSEDIEWKVLEQIE